MKTDRVRVLVVDDHPVVRHGIRSCLEHSGRVEVVGEAADGTEALYLAKERQPDIVLTDVEIPHMNGLMLAEALRREVPQARVLVLSMYNTVDYVLRIIQSGAKGYVLKDASLGDLLQAIEAVQRGDTFFSPEAARLALTQFVTGRSDGAGPSRLTSRERGVLVKIAAGLSNREIAEHLGIGTRTVETHREHIMRKLDIHSVAGLTKYAIAQGLAPLEGKELPQP